MIEEIILAFDRIIQIITIMEMIIVMVEMIDLVKQLIYIQIENLD
jgi:hypothetical protein